MTISADPEIDQPTEEALPPLTEEEVLTVAATIKNLVDNYHSTLFSCEHMANFNAKQNKAECIAMARRGRHCVDEAKFFNARLQAKPQAIAQQYDLRMVEAAIRALEGPILTMKGIIGMQSLPSFGPVNPASVIYLNSQINTLHRRFDDVSSGLQRSLVERPQALSVESQKAQLREIKKQIDEELVELDRIRHQPPEINVRMSLADERARWLHLAIDQKHLRAIPREQVITKKFLRSGGFGSISYALWDDTPVVLKKLFDTTDFVEEVRLLKRVHDGDGVVKLHGIMYDEKEEPIMVMKYAANGSLTDYLAKDHAGLSWSDKYLLAEQITCGLGFIHREGILHRDFHSGNILIDANGSPMITDFGLSGSNEVKEDTEAASGVIGVVAYIAPERLMDPSMTYTAAMDIYSLGVIMWQVSSGKRPFTGQNDVSLAFGILMDERREDIVPGTAHGYSRIYRACWDAEPEKRPALGVIKRIITHLREGEDGLLPLHPLPAVEGSDSPKNDSSADPADETKSDSADEEEEEHLDLMLETAYISLNLDG